MDLTKIKIWLKLVNLALNNAHIAVEEMYGNWHILNEKNA